MDTDATTTQRRQEGGTRDPSKGRSALAPAAALIADSEEVLRRHARSFRWAAPFLPRDARADAAVTYAFCRFLDDVVDERQSDEAALRVLREVEAEVRGNAPARPLVAAYLDIARRRGIPADAALALLEGMRSDMEEVRVEDDDELRLYCFRVAGVVGLMMAPILGTTDPTALRHATDLGIGMQLSNICRDVREDAERGRVYLPAARLRRVGVTPADILAGRADPNAVLSVVIELLESAEDYYASGQRGLRYLPGRARLAIAIAARLYRAIGLRVRQLGVLALRSRAFVSPVRKIAWLGVALMDALGAPQWLPAALRGPERLPPPSWSPPPPPP